MRSWSKNQVVLERTFFIMMQQSTLDKLNKLAGQETTSNKQMFKRIVVALGPATKPVEHYPKLKDENGKTVKDEKGNDKRSDKSDGFMFTFSDFKTSRMVKVVLDKKYDVKVMQAYIISGLGYDLRGAGFVYLDENCTIKNYE